MKSNLFINYSDPQTTELLRQIRCNPTAPSLMAQRIADKALNEVRRRYAIPERYSFRLLTLNEPLMERHLLALLQQEFLPNHPNASDEEAVLWLTYSRRHRPFRFLLTPAEEHILIAAVQNEIPYAIEIAFCFFALKVVSVIKVYQYGIDSQNVDDIETACCMALLRQIHKFNLDQYPGGLVQQYVKYSLANEIFEIFGYNYPATLSRYQISLLHELHKKMKDPSFRRNSALKRSELSKIPMELICIYDSLNNEAYGSLNTLKTESDDLSLATEYNDFNHFSSIHSNEDYHKAEDKESLQAILKDPVTKEFIRAYYDEVRIHSKRPSTAEKYIRKQFARIRKKYKISDAEWEIKKDDIRFAIGLLLETTPFFAFE